VKASVEIEAMQVAAGLALPMDIGIRLKKE
jgi:hypothetical protein